MKSKTRGLAWSPSPSPPCAGTCPVQDGCRALPWLGSAGFGVNPWSSAHERPPRTRSPLLISGGSRTVTSRHSSLCHPALKKVLGHLDCGWPATAVPWAEFLLWKMSFVTLQTDPWNWGLCLVSTESVSQKMNREFAQRSLSLALRQV